MKEQVLMKQMLRLLDQQWVTEIDFDKLLETVEVSDPEAQIFAMTKVVDLIRMLPEEIFSNLENKQNMQQAAQDCLDGLVEAENGEDLADVVAESDQGYGILGDITIPGVIDHGTVTGADAGQSNTMIPTLGAPSVGKDTKK